MQKDRRLFPGMAACQDTGKPFMPPEFIDGMKVRAHILGDSDPDVSEEELVASVNSYEAAVASNGRTKAKVPD